MNKRKNLYAFTPWSHTNRAVRVAKSLQLDALKKTEQLEIGHLLARAQYARGSIKMIWGHYGFQDENGRFKQNPEYMQDAIDDFTRAAKQAAPVLKGSLYKELARAQGFKQYNETTIMLAFNTLKMAEAYIGVTGTNDDPYMPTLQDGTTVGGLNEGGYLLGSAILLNAVKRPGKAQEKLLELEKLSTGRIPRDWTRQQAWIDIVYAQAAFGTKEYDMAKSKAKSALLICQDIQSTNNIAIVKDLYLQLLSTSYKNEQNMKDLGRLLRGQQSLK